MAAVDVARISEQKEFAGRPFPLVLSPAASPSPSFEAAAAWVSERREWIYDQLVTHGAILFRGFPTLSPEEFDAFVNAFGWENLPYVGGAAVRKGVVSDRVVTTNESPPDQLIPFHHEMAQVPTFPSKLFFFAELPSSTGGETPIVRSDLVYEALKERQPKFVEEIEKRLVRYIRVLPEEDDPTSAIGRGWKSTYKVETREEVEAKMAEMGVEWEWLEDGSVKTISPALPAVKEDPRTGKKVFFNSIVAAYLGWKDSRNVPEKAVVYGDDLSPVDAAAIADAAKIMEDLKVAFPWHQGDVLLVDNILSMHARNTFEGPRKILAALIK